MKIIQSRSADVSRASHCHQTPHAFRPQSGPVMSTIAPNSTVNSAAAAARRSADGLPVKRNMALADAETNAARNIVIPAGTWK